MKLIEQYHEIITPLNDVEIMRFIEVCGRTCYKSEDKITPTSSEKFVRMLIANGHHSVLEHFNISVRFVTNRGVTHELVRHRLCAYSQESTRYCDYSGEIEFIFPIWNYDELGSFEEHLQDVEDYYRHLRRAGWRPEQAREILPNCLKTEIICTTNIREWRHILNLRCSPKTHPQMRALMIGLLRDLKSQLPVLFEDLYPNKED